MFRCQRLIPLTCAVALSSSATALAHDLWLLPSPELSRRQVVFVTQGMVFGESDSAPDVNRFLRRQVHLPSGAVVDLTSGRPSRTAGVMTFEAAETGTYVIGLESQPKVFELEAKVFNSYLVTDGMPHIYNQRSKDGTLDRSARERYGKSVKALWKNGEGKGDFGRVLGHRLELVPLDNPFTRKPGDTLRIKVLHHSQPVAGARVGWQLPESGDEPNGYTRSNGDGVAYVPISQTGPMSIRLTHMTQPKTKEFEWESFWATVTFAIPK